MTLLKWVHDPIILSDDPILTGSWRLQEGGEDPATGDQHFAQNRSSNADEFRGAAAHLPAGHARKPRAGEFFGVVWTLRHPFLCGFKGHQPENYHFGGYPKHTFAKEMEFP